MERKAPDPGQGEQLVKNFSTILLDAGNYWGKNAAIQEELAEVGTSRGAEFTDNLLHLRIVNNEGTGEIYKLEAGSVEGWAELQDVGDVFEMVA